MVDAEDREVYADPTWHIHNPTADDLENYYFRSLQSFYFIDNEIARLSSRVSKKVSLSPLDTGVMLGGIALVRNNYAKMNPDMVAQIDDYKQVSHKTMYPADGITDEYFYTFYVAAGKFPNFFSDLSFVGQLVFGGREEVSTRQFLLSNDKMLDLSDGWNDQDVAEEIYTTQEGKGKFPTASIVEQQGNDVFLTEGNRYTSVTKRRWMSFCNPEQAKEVKNDLVKYHGLQKSQTQQEKKQSTTPSRQ